MASRSAPARTLCSSTSPRCTSCSEEARTSTRPWPGPFWTRRPASIVSSAPGRKPSGTTRGGERKPHLPEGFTAAKDLRYILRPEAIESVFYMYRITGDKAFQTRRGTCSPPSTMKTDYANAAVLDVIVARYPLPKVDYMESFWLAETLKYFYLVFSTPDVISLDEYVLNTEAHPFRILG